MSHVTLDQSGWRIMSRVVPQCTTQPMVSTRAANCTHSSAAGTTPVHCRQESKPSRYRQIKSFCSSLTGWGLGTEHLSCSLDSSRSRWWPTSFCHDLGLHGLTSQNKTKRVIHAHREPVTILSSWLQGRETEREREKRERERERERERDRDRDRERERDQLLLVV